MPGGYEIYGFSDRTFFFRNTVPGLKVPMADSKAVDEVQLCKGDKLCRIKTAKFLARIRVGYSGERSLFTTWGRH